MRRRSQTLGRLTGLVLAVTVTVSGAACTADNAPAADQGTPDDGDVSSDRFVERVFYPVRDGAADPTQNWADFYLPGGDIGPDTVPLVVFLHGGAWHGGAEGSRRMAEELTRRGLAVYNVEYSDIDDGGGWPRTFSDVADALDHVPELYDRYPVLDTDDAVVVGHSAGAQLATWAGTRSDLHSGELGADPRFVPTRVVSLAGPLDMVWAAEHGDDNIVEALSGKPDDIPARYSSVDPIQNLNPRTPVVAVHGTSDGLVPHQNSRRYINALTRAGGDGTLILLDGEDHTSFLKATSENFNLVLDTIHDVATYPDDQLGDELDGLQRDVIASPGRG